MTPPARPRWSARRWRRSSAPPPSALPPRRDAPPAAAPERLRAGEARRRRRGGAHALDPLVEREVAGDEAGERGDDRRGRAGAVERAGEQRDEVEGLDRLTDARGDVGGRHAFGEQLAGTAVAALRRERGPDQVAGSREPDQRLRPRALHLRVAPHLEEDVPGGGAGGVEALRLGGGGGERGGVLRRAGQLDADRVVRALADDAGA